MHRWQNRVFFNLRVSSGQFLFLVPTLLINHSAQSANGRFIPPLGLLFHPLAPSGYLRQYAASYCTLLLNLLHQLFTRFEHRHLSQHIRLLFLNRRELRILPNSNSTRPISRLPLLISLFVLFRHTNDRSLSSSPKLTCRTLFSFEARV